MGNQAEQINKNPQATSEQHFDSAAPRNRIVDEMHELLRYRDLVKNLVRRNVTARYKRSVLGVLWTLLDPFFTMLIMAAVFSALFAQTVPGYPVFIFAGVIIWNFFAQSSTQAMVDFVYSGSLIVQVYMPKTVFAFSAIGTGLVNLGLACIPLLAIMVFLHRPITTALMFLPIAVLLASMFTLGMGLLVSALAVFFADMINIYSLVLRLGMYLSGIFFSVEALPEGLRHIIALIPTYQMVEMFRYPVYHGELPPVTSVLYFSVWAIVMLGAGMLVFTRLSDEYAYRV
jgi:ABC-type polysaccharide/polyol phosphate export permease